MKEQLDTLIGSGKPVLVKFHAEWCAPCKAMSPIIERVKGKFGETIETIDINIESDMDIAREFGVRAIPNIMVMGSGDEIRVSDKTEDGITNALNEMKSRIDGSDLTDVEL